MYNFCINLTTFIEVCFINFSFVFEKNLLLGKTLSSPTTVTVAMGFPPNPHSPRPR